MVNKTKVIRSENFEKKTRWFIQVRTEEGGILKDLLSIQITKAEAEKLIEMGIELIDVTK